MKSPFNSAKWQAGSSLPWLPALIVFCIAALAGCAKDEVPAPDVRPVRTLIVAGGSGSRTTSYTAEIRSRVETDMSFQVGGKLIARAVDVGATVRKGALLARLDQTDLRLGVDASTAALNAARAELDRARTEEARYRDLLERGLTTRASYLSQQTAVKTGQSKVEQAAADLKLSQQKLGYATLTADQEGVVTDVLAEVGTVVAAGQKIVSIARPSELEAVFDVPDSQIEAVRRATAVQFAFLTAPGTPFPARVREISPSADPVTRTFEVKTSIPNPPTSLRLGMTVVVQLPHDGNRSNVTLPATALFQKERDTAVWVVKDDLTLELRPVSIERYESDRIVVSSGLAVGEKVVTAGVHRLAAGQTVRLLEGVAP